MMEIFVFLIVAFLIYTFGYNHGLSEMRKKIEEAKDRLINDDINPDEYFDD